MSTVLAVSKQVNCCFVFFNVMENNAKRYVVKNVHSLFTETIHTVVRPEKSFQIDC